MTNLASPVPTSNTNAQEESGETSPKEAMAAIRNEGENLLKDMHAAALVYPPTIEYFFNELHLNRCPHLLCYDHTRVVLNDKLDVGNYYNASFVDSYKIKGGYVFAQAPFTDRTETDFWRMVVNVKPSIIIVLGAVDEDQGNRISEMTNEIDKPEWRDRFLSAYGVKNIEDAESKMHIVRQFWPAESKTYCKDGALVVSRDKVTPDRHITTYSLNLTVAKEEKKSVTLVHFNQWMDDSPMPEYISDMRAMIKITTVRAGKNPNTYRGPLLLVCPTGISRCGSYALLDIVTARIADEKNVGVRESMVAIKSQRYGCFRNPDHYQMIREILLRTCITSGAAHDEAIGEKAASRRRKKSAAPKKKGVRPSIFMLNKKHSN